MPKQNPQQLNTRLIEKTYQAAIDIFEKAGYTKIESVGVSPEANQATAFKNPHDGQLYILYRPSDSEDDDFVFNCNESLCKKMGNDKKIHILEAKRVYLTVNKNNLYSLSIDGIDRKTGKNTKDFETKKQQPKLVLNDIRRIIQEKNNQTIELGFFARRPWIKDVAIGVGVGLAIAGVITAVVLTAGAALIPTIAGIGAAASFGSGAIVGLAAIGTAFIAGCAAVAFGFGKLFDRKKSNQKQDIRNPRTEDGSWFNPTYVQIIKSERFGNVIKNSEYKPREGEIDKVIDFLKANIEFFTAPFKNQNAFSKWVNEDYNARIFSETFSYALQRNQSSSGEANIKDDISPIFNFKNALLGESETLGIDLDRITERKKELAKMLVDSSLSEKDKITIQNRLSLLEEQIQNIKAPRLTGLADGDVSAMREFLENNPKVVLFLSRRLDDSHLLDTIKKWNTENNVAQQSRSNVVEITQAKEKGPQVSSDELPILEVKASRKG